MPRFSNAVIVPTLFGLLGAAIILWLTRRGVGLVPDSHAYLIRAESLREGRMFYEAHRPPLYSAALAVLAPEGGLAGAARVVAVVSFGSTIALVAHAVGSAVRSRWAGAIAAVLAITSVPLLSPIPFAMSEALFIVLTVLSLWLLHRYVQAPGYVRLLAAAVVVDLAVLARYMGAALIMTGLALIALRTPGSALVRAGRSAIFGLVCAAGPAGFIWLHIAAGQGTPRALVFHPISAVKLRDGLESFGQLVAPAAIPIGLRVALLVGLGALGWLAWRRTSGTAAELGVPSRPFVIVLGVFLVAFLVMLLGTLFFLDAAVPLSHRILAPAYVTLIMLGVTVGATSLKAPGIASRTRSAVVMAGVVLTVASVVAAAVWIPANDDGLGYSSPRWRSSPLIEAVRSTGVLAVVSNQPAAIYFLTDKQFVRLPGPTSPVTRQPRPSYEAEMRTIERFVREGATVVAYFRPSDPARYATEEEVFLRLRPVSVRRFADGNLYERRSAR